MAEIVNLRRVKRQRARADAAAQAAENRARHGQTRAERDADQVRKTAAERTLNGARLDRDGEPRE